MKRGIFCTFPSPKQANRGKDHFAMQTRLNLRKQLFVKTKNFSFKLRSLLSINQYSKRIPQRCVVFMDYVPWINNINTTYISKI